MCQPVTRLSPAHQFADVDGVEGNLWLWSAVSTELDAGQQPHEDADSIQDGCVSEAERQVHRVVGSAGLVVVVAV